MSLTFLTYESISYQEISIPFTSGKIQPEHLAMQKMISNAVWRNFMCVYTRERVGVHERERESQGIYWRRCV